MLLLPFDQGEHMITLDDYHALLGRILNPNQPNYTYLSYHRKACTRVIEAAPKGMRARLAAVLLEEALAQEINLKRPDIFDDLEWRYGLSTYIGGQKRLLRRLLNLMLNLKLIWPEHLSWVTDLAERSGTALNYGLVDATIGKYDGHDYDAFRAFAKTHLEGGDLDRQLTRLDRAQDNYDTWVREENRLNYPG